MTHSSVTLNGHTLRVRDYLSNKPTSIILIHGIGVSSEYFIEYATALAAHYNVYALDLPGYGTAPKPPHPLSIKELGEIVVTFARHARVKQAILIGQSMGCQIVAHAIASAPNEFKKAILLAPTSNIFERSLFIQGVRLFQDTLRESFAINKVVFRNYLRMGVRRYLITAHDMVKDRIEHTLKANTIPLLIVRGENDLIVPRKWTAYLHQVVPNSQVTELPKVPHLLQCQAPQQLSQITKAFIDQ